MLRELSKVKHGNEESGFGESDVCSKYFGGDCPGPPNNADLASRGQTRQQATVCLFAFTGGGGLELPLISVKATGNSDSGSIWQVP
jgi:hypothetical protein